MIGINSTLPMASLQQCLTIDSGYQNCFQHLARAYPIKGDVETALKLCNETLEHMLHSTSDGLVSTYVRNDSVTWRCSSPMRDWGLRALR
jgi:hypothetical protein